MIPLSASEISALDGFCDSARGRARAGIGYSSSWIQVEDSIPWVVPLAIFAFNVNFSPQAQLVNGDAGDKY